MRVPVDSPGMKLHLHTTLDATKSGAVTTDLLTLTDLVRHRILRRSSEVWLSTETHHPVLWTLDATSRLIYVHRSRPAGVFKLTPDRLRWCPALGEKPTIDVTATELTGSRTARIQFVLLDSRGPEHMKVYDAVTNSLLHPEPDTGWIIHGRWTIINAATSTVWEWNGEPKPTAVHEAHALGGALLTSTLSEQEALEAADALDEIVIEVSDSSIESIENVHTYAQQATEYIEKMMAQARSA